MVEIEAALLLRLLDEGLCRESARGRSVLERLERARWIERSTRAGDWTLAPTARPQIELRLAEILPTWRKDVQILLAHGLKPTDPRNLQDLPALRAVPAAAGFLHRKVWNAASTAGSKLASRIPSGALLTDDWAQRGRVSCRTVLRTEAGEVDLLDQTRLLSEFCIPERAWRAAVGFTGQLPGLVLTVENLGPLVDLALPSACMILYSQGAAVRGAAEVLKALPSANWLHFGDLDVSGLQFGERLGQLAGRSPTFFVPTFAAEYLHRARKVRRMWSSSDFGLPLVRELMQRNAWLEQEGLLLDPRLPAELEALATLTRVY